MKKQQRKLTKKAFEKYLNIDAPMMRGYDVGIPGHSDNYGTWLRRNDPIAFQVGYNEWVMENE